MRSRKLLLALIPICLALLAVIVIVAGSMNNAVSAKSQNGPVSHLSQPIHPVTGPDRGLHAIKPHLHPVMPTSQPIRQQMSRKFVLANGAPAESAGSWRTHDNEGNPVCYGWAGSAIAGG